MLNTEVSALNHTLLETQEWLDELVRIGPFQNAQQAYSHLRAVLHTLRDRLIPDEAVHLAAQMPMLVRGFYYEGWRPSLAPNEERTVPEFMDSIRESLHAVQITEDELRESVRAVFTLLTNRLSEGQVRHAREQLPGEVQELWSA